MSLSLFLLLSLLLPSLLKRGSFPMKDGVLLLTDYTFEEAFDEFEFVLISAHSHECGACRTRIGPAFRNISLTEAKRFGIDRDKVAVALIEGAYNRDFMSRFGTLGYPSVYLVHKGKNLGELPAKYDVRNLIAYIRKYTNGPVQKVENRDVFELLKDYVPSSPLLLYIGSSPSELKTLSILSESLPSLTVAQLFSPRLERELGFPEGTLALFKTFDEGNVTEARPAGGWDEERIRKFLGKYNHRVVVTLGEGEADARMKKRKGKVLLFVHGEGEGMKKFRELAVKLRGDIQNMQIKYNHDEYKKLGEQVRKDGNKGKPTDLFDNLDPFGFERQRRNARAAQLRAMKFVRSLLGSAEKENTDSLFAIEFSGKEPSFARVNFSDFGKAEEEIRMWSQNKTVEGMKFENIEEYDEFFPEK